MDRPESKRFHETRRRLTEAAAEDYCELIATLTEEHGEARIKTIAATLGVSHVTAIRTLQRLSKEGFVTTERRQPVGLTPKGLKTALDAKHRHELLVRFFVALGVSKKTAEVDVEGVEHYLSSESIRAVERYLRSKSKS